MENQLLDQVCQQEFLKFYPNNHHTLYLTSNLLNDAEQTFKYKWPKELETSITRYEMKEMLTLCTKNVHFTYNRNNDVAMGSPLGPTLADIFMTELEKTPTT